MNDNTHPPAPAAAPGASADLSTAIAALESALTVLRRLAASAKPPAPPADTAAPAAVATPNGDAGPPGAAAPTAPLARAFLAARGIQIRRDGGPLAPDPALDRVSTQLGDHYAELGPLYEAMKSALDRGYPVSFKLADREDFAVNRMIDFAASLHQLAMLSYNRYKRVPFRRIHCRPNTGPQARAFLTGGWLERYVAGRVAAAAAAAGLPCGLLRNVEVALPNGENGELDTVAEIAGRLFWIEAKSGDYQRHIERYRRLARYIALPAAQRFLVLCDRAAGPDTCASLSGLYGMTVVPVERFAERFAAALPPAAAQAAA